MKKVWIIAILILIILLLGGGIFWLAQSMSERSSQSADKPAPTPTPVTFTDDVKLYMIAIDDDGQMGDKVGCGDSIVEVVHTVTKTDILTGTYEDLLALSEPMYGESGLYNPIAKSDLTLNSATVDNAGVAQVSINGTLDIADCDAPRVQAQLELPAKQFPGVTGVNVTLNGKPLSESLAQ